MSSNLTQGTVGYPNGRGIGLRSRSVRVRIPLPLRSSSPTAEASASNTDQSRFESGGEYVRGNPTLGSSRPRIVGVESKPAPPW